MSLKNLVTQKDLRFLLFGGKGGVGKTSSSAATSVWLADHGQEVLILSTDPAHSLSDSFDQNLSGGEIVPIKGAKGLYGLEMDPKKEYSKYQKTMQESDVEIPKEIGFMMDGLEDMQAMTPPGTDETLAFSKVLEFIQTTEEYDTIIFDTAPTGHTLRLLHLPTLLNSFFGKIITFRMKMGQIWGKMKAFFKREDYEDDSLDQLKRLKEVIEEANKQLTDPKKTSFVIVMIAEMMAIYETERLLENLYEVEIPCSSIIVNQLFPQNLDVDCKFCNSRRDMQQKNLKEIKDIYAEDFNLIEVRLFPTEIRGLDKLRE
ncbi:MAG: ArsA family ATPase, partial [Candidatus Helarchaeota archaeon]